LDAQNNETDRVDLEAAKNPIEDCDRRMIRYRSTLDAGGDPQEIGKWMAETRAERMQAEGRMRTITRKREISEKEIKEMIPQMTEMVRILEKADPVDKNDLYTQMALNLVYNPSERVVLVEARPSMYQSACPRGDTSETYIPFAASTRLILPGQGW
jgi:site-specific DNA recombinase